MTFDSLRPRYDHGDALTVTLTAHGPHVYTLSPHYSTGTNTGTEALRLGDITNAFARSEMISESLSAKRCDRVIVPNCAWRTSTRAPVSQPTDVRSSA